MNSEEGDEVTSTGGENTMGLRLDLSIVLLSAALMALTLSLILLGAMLVDTNGEVGLGEPHIHLCA